MEKCRPGPWLGADQQIMRGCALYQLCRLSASALPTGEGKGCALSRIRNCTCRLSKRLDQQARSVSRRQPATYDVLASSESALRWCII
jgi:hypothetical protein